MNKTLKEKLELLIREELEKIMSEVAPPGMEDMVLALKKRFGEKSPIPFQIAWKKYNQSHKKHKKS